MKFLFITTKPLLPNNSGYTVRLYNILKYLKNQGHYITLISFVSKSENDVIQNSKEELSLICDSFKPIYINKKLAYFNCIKALFSGKPFKAEYYNTLKAKKIVKTELQNQKYDYVAGYLYLTSQFLDIATKEKKWMDLIDSISMLHERRFEQCSNLFAKIFLGVEKKRVQKIEKHCIQDYNFVTMISEVDKQYLSKFVDSSSVNIIKNGVNVDERISDIYNPNQIAYLGDMAYIQNHDAVMWFIENVLPQLIKNNPNIKFKIIGKNPKTELIEYCKDKKNIIITGQVDDVKKELLDSAILVCPIKISSGLQNKVLEAMSIGVPAIVSSQVAKPITNDEKVLIQADSFEDWINKITEITNDERFRNELSVNAKIFIEQNFSWKENLTGLEKVLSKQLSVKECL